jgi:Domain of unknown function (DUF4333)
VPTTGRKLRMFARSLRAALAVGSLALLTPGCTRSLDTSSVVPELQRVLVKQYGLREPTVSCPSTVKVHAGATFTCTGTDASGITFTFTITQKDDRGRLSWKVTDVSSAGGTEISSPPTPSSST